MFHKYLVTREVENEKENAKGHEISDRNCGVLNSSDMGQIKKE